MLLSDHRLTPRRIPGEGEDEWPFHRMAEIRKYIDMYSLVSTTTIRSCYTPSCWARRSRPHWTWGRASTSRPPSPECRTRRCWCGNALSGIGLGLRAGRVLSRAGDHSLTPCRHDLSPWHTYGMDMNMIEIKMSRTESFACGVWRMKRYEFQGCFWMFAIRELTMVFVLK